MIQTSACFSYDLPVDRIAQRPVRPYDHAKLLVVDRTTSMLSERTFETFDELVGAGDLLIFNNSRVIPARFFGVIEDRSADVELLLVRKLTDSQWVCIGKPLKKLAPGSQVHLTEALRASVLERSGEMEIIVKFETTDSSRNLGAEMETAGCMPIPPYIRAGHGDAQDREDYQALFARRAGSVAAPTASLHFTDALLNRIRAARCEIAEITLHIGPPSFLPLWRQDAAIVTPPGKEQCIFSTQVLERARETRKRGGRVIAVGTTVLRAIESMAGASELTEGESFETGLFISPEYTFKVASNLVTNFHQPHSSHLLLVQALMGRMLLEKSYQYALSHDFRFLSYGDGMFI